jgi:XTP/dITP diphosphohydrolase
MTLRLVLATHNQHKVEEFASILGQAVPGIEIVAYDGPEPVESGVSFAENALIKARTAAEHTGLPALADDSGICVDVLGGAPGIFSARWAGSHGDSAANLALLLDQISDIAEPSRGAHFTSTIALVTPMGAETVVEGVWPGRIAAEPRGTNGFGYDPAFIPEGLDISAAQLSASEKNSDSHRARAFAQLVPALVGLQANRGGPSIN